MEINLNLQKRQKRLGRSWVNYTKYEEYVNSRFRLVAMLNFTHYGIYSQLVTIARRAIQINFGFTISSQSQFMAIKSEFKKLRLAAILNFNHPKNCIDVHNGLFDSI